MADWQGVVGIDPVQIKAMVRSAGHNPTSLSRYLGWQDRLLSFSLRRGNMSMMHARQLADFFDVPVATIISTPYLDRMKGGKTA